MNNDVVFISYSRKDLGFVKLLHQHLESSGLPAWFDQVDIPPGNQWREAIVRAISECQIFLLVLSPAAVESKHVRKELDLAERRNKQVVPVVWQHTALPAGMEYQLVGIQYFDFNGNATPENFSKLAKALHTVLKTPCEQSQYLSIWKAKATGMADRFSQSVMARVIVPLTIDTAQQTALSAELRWLFAAAQQFIEIRRGNIVADSPVPAPIPPTANRHRRADNRLLSGIDDFSLRMVESQLISLFKQLRTYLRNLSTELRLAAENSGTASDAITRQNSIKAQRQIVAERIQRMEKLVRNLYGVMLPGPQMLVDYLDSLSD